MKTGNNNLSPPQIGIKTVKTDELHPNPHNPRMLFDKEPLDVLQESINKVGILVPLTIYFDSKKKYYVILDGQRRWHCAQNLKLKTVPVNQVGEPTLVQNIVTMFQIHKLREDWELMPTALKLEVLMEELQEKTDIKKIAELTGLPPSTVLRCKKLLDYPKKYQDMMIDADPAKRVKADFFIELHVVRNDRFVNSFTWFKKDEFTKDMLHRYQSKKLKAVTDFRIIKQHITNAKKAKKEAEISRRLKAFSKNENLPISHLEIAAESAKSKEIFKKVEKLKSDIKSIDVESMYGENDLWDALESLIKIITKKLSEAGRRI